MGQKKTNKKTMQTISCELTAELWSANSDNAEPCLNVLIPETYYHNDRVENKIETDDPFSVDSI